MKLLCIDTALASCSACVYDASAAFVLAAEQQFMERGHAEALPPMVARVMAMAQIGYGDLGRIAVTTGPGTFTGIRIGLSFARALGLARNIKVLGINTMVATQVAVSESNIIVIHKAGMSGLLYYFDKNSSASIELLKPEAIVAQLPVGPLVLLGTGADAIASLASRDDLTRYPRFDLPVAQGFAAYAASLPDPFGMPDPVYLREADAKPQKESLRALAQIEIKVAGQEDFALLSQLHSACFEKAWSESEISSLIGSPGCSALLAYAVDGPIGFLVYRAIADEAEIISIGVDPAFRRRGAGQNLLKLAVTMLKSFKIKSLFLEVATSNREAISLYTKAGFAEVGRRRNYYALPNGRFEDALILRLNLN